MDNVEDLTELETIKVKFIGKKGTFTDLMKTLGGLDPQNRSEVGKTLNLIKKEIEEKLYVKKIFLDKKLLDEKIKHEKIDISLP